MSFQTERTPPYLTVQNNKTHIPQDTSPQHFRQLKSRDHKYFQKEKTGHKSIRQPYVTRLLNTTRH